MPIVLQLSDSHLRADDRKLYDQDPIQRLRLVLDACARELPRIDLVLLSGDQSDDGELASLQRVREMAGGLGAPLLAIPGNHDALEAHEATFGPGGPVELDGWRVIGLDSSIPGEIHGSVDVPAIERQLDGLDRRSTLLAVHHPPVSPTTHPWFQLEHADELLRALAARPHVRAVASGHVHSPFTFSRGPLALLGGPSTLAPFEFDGGEFTVGAGGPVGARVITLRDDGSLSSALIEA